MKKRWWRLLVAFSSAALNAVAAAALGLKTAGIVKLPRWLTVAAISVVALTAVLRSAQAALLEFRGVRVEELRRTFEMTLRVILCTIATHARLGSCDLGIAVWTLRRRPPLVGRKQLWPIFRQRAAYGDGPSGVTWRPGKGIHGRCVESGTYLWRDLGADSEIYRNVQDKDWPTVPDEVRQDMTLMEFRRAVGRYRFVAAAPIIQQVGGHEETVGCVTLDVPSTGSGAKLTRQEISRLTAQTVEQVLKGAAGMVGNYLP